MSVLLGDTAPDFTQDSTEGPIRFHHWLGDRWGILFSHPKDFTPVCTTELAEAARLGPEFERRGVKIIGLSVDTLDSHRSWQRDIAETQGHGIDFPLLADADRKVSTLYGMIHPKSDPALTVRSVFVIAPDKTVRLTLTYPPSTGRSFDEILRVIDSLQLTDAQKVATPVNWRPGDDVIILPSLADADAERRFPNGWKTARPYLRIV
ncbi:MAG TPA: peroxiredoxin, partial [Candidatus Angelobacter sp.]|nr:peroxiredoxin [Candidatus Angelobacter sp.]